MTQAKTGWQLGLTGGMGCGKSTAADFFEGLGFERLDSDVLVRELLASDAAVHATLRERWGSRVFTAEGKVDRRAVGAIVFSDPRELDWLESALHPRVRTLWQRWLSERTHKRCLVEIPLLFEKNLEKHFDSVVCVTCSDVTQRARLRARNLQEADISARLQRQLPLSEKVQRADFVLSNDGSADFLKKQIVHFIQFCLPRCPQAASETA
ncbi:MAG: dephospho-CoA kinase [Opitutales bacterium]